MTEQTGLKRSNIADYFFLMRPILFIPLWAPIFLAYAACAQGETFSFNFLLPLRFWLIFASYTLLMGAVYIVNQIEDRDSDLINNKLFLIPRGIISIKTAWIEATALIVASATIAIITQDMAFYFVWLVSLLLGLAYSLPPFKLKSRPFADVLANTIGYGLLAYISGWISIKDFSITTLWYSLPLFFFVLAVFLNTTIPDIKGDKASGEITTGVFLGQRTTTIVSAISMFYAFVFAFIIMDIFILIASTVGLILFIIAIFDDSDFMPKVSYRISSFLFVLLVALKFPIFLGICILDVVLLRVYYTKRFNINYPTFLGR